MLFQVKELSPADSGNHITHTVVIAKLGMLVISCLISCLRGKEESFLRNFFICG